MIQTLCRKPPSTADYTTLLADKDMQTILQCSVETVLNLLLNTWYLSHWHMSLQVQLLATFMERKGHFFIKAVKLESDNHHILMPEPAEKPWLYLQRSWEQTFVSSPKWFRAPRAYNCSRAKIRVSGGGGSMKSKWIKSLIPRLFKMSTTLPKFVLWICINTYVWW